MYKTLAENLKLYSKGERGNLFWVIEDIGYVHLGVADKFLLIKELENYDHQGWFDLQLHAARILHDMGYQSDFFESILKEDNEHCPIVSNRWAYSWEMHSGRTLEETGIERKPLR